MFAQVDTYLCTPAVPRSAFLWFTPPAPQDRRAATQIQVWPCIPGWKMQRIAVQTPLDLLFWVFFGGLIGCRQILSSLSACGFSNLGACALSLHVSIHGEGQNEFPNPAWHQEAPKYQPAVEATLLPPIHLTWVCF